MYLELAEVAVLLAALTIAAPLARWLRIGPALAYLLVGVALGPHGIRLAFSFTDYKAKTFLEASEFGIVLLLFLIGLELRPRRLRAMRSAILELGVSQLVVTGAALALVAIMMGLEWRAGLFVGLALALSSTAFALQVLEETGELSARHGRLGFAVLLFQDLAAIPLIALVPLFAAGGAGQPAAMDTTAALEALVTIAGVVVVGYFRLDRLIRLVALTRVREAMTAVALLTVVSVAGVMQAAGVSASLGAFIAGALLSESSYRHQLEADIQPFEGLLLGVFFTTIGMTLNLELLFSRPLAVVGLAAGLIAVKTAILFGLGRWQGLSSRGARRLGLVLSQGGEFGFVLLTAGAGAAVLSNEAAALLNVVVTLSMAATPVLLIGEGLLFRTAGQEEEGYETPPATDGHVIIAGFGRFGQITARVLRGKGIPFIALDISAEQVELVKRFGAEAFYGDASRPEVLSAAQANRARALVLAIDDVEASLRTAIMVKQLYPQLPIYARARNRNHALRLLDLGITNLQRETYLSALDITRQVLKGLGYSDRETDRIIATFRAHDERRLIEDYKHYSDVEKLQAKARSDAATLERLFAEDAAEEARLREAAAAKERA